MFMAASSGARLRQVAVLVLGVLVLGAVFALPHRFGVQQRDLIAAVSWPSLAMLAAAGAALGTGGALWNAAYGQPERELYIFAIPLGAALLGGYLGSSGASAMLGGVLIGAAGFAALAWFLLRRNRLLVFVLAAAVPASVYVLLWAAGYGKARLTQQRAFLLWLLGDASDASAGAALLLGCAVCGLLAVALIRARSLAALSITARDGALSSAERTQLGLLAFALYGLCFGAIGPVAFVGLAAPWLVRRLAGPQAPLHALVLCALSGAATLSALDAVPRALVGAFTYPLAMQTALVFGVPCAVLRSRELAQSGAPPSGPLLDWLQRAWLTVVAAFALFLIVFAGYLGLLFK
jgi:iron complex transport system permease protein